MDEDYVDEVSDERDSMQDVQDAQLDSYEATYPESKTKSDLYTWFWKVVRLDEPNKVVKTANLNHAEIGEHGISVRDALNLGNLGLIFNHPMFGEYWDTRAKIISATSMAKKGWFMDLSISQRKVRQREKSDSSGKQQPWRLFQKKPIPEV